MARPTTRYKKKQVKVKPPRKTAAAKKTEHFAIFFGPSGTPLLRALEHDPDTDTFRKLPLTTRTIQRRVRAEESLAGQLFSFLRQLRD